MFTRGFQVAVSGLCGLFALATANALVLEGQVTDSSGAPVPGVMVTVISSSAAAEKTKVFTGADGRYHVPDFGKSVHVNSLRIKVSKLGYDQSAPATDVLTQLLKEEPGEVVEVDFTMKPITNIAHQVPASAWLAKAPDGAATNRTILACTQCHQLPNERVINFAKNLAGLDENQREQSWRAMTSYMRIAFYGVLQAEHAPSLDDLPIATLMDPAHSFINQEDEDMLAPLLAKYLPTNFDHFDVKDASVFTSGKLGVNKRTLIREYPWPETGSFLRETVVVDGDVWSVDIQRNRLAKLNKETGGYTWYDVPLVGASAPHTLVPDAEGNIWITLLGGMGQAAAMFNPKTEAWRFYDGFAAGLAAHDFSAGRNYTMEFDDKGFNWMTIIDRNDLVGFNRDSGEIITVDLPLAPGETRDNELHACAYGAGMTSDKNVWFAQCFGRFGRFNTKTMEFDHLVDFPETQGPHRFQVGDDDLIYVSLLGSSEVMIYDGKALKEVKRIKMPDSRSALYSLLWDPVRKVIWSGVINNDTIFRIDPVTEEITEYPMGIKDLHIRMMAIDKDNGDIWITNSPLPPEDHETNRLFLFRPGDI